MRLIHRILGGDTSKVFVSTIVLIILVESLLRLAYYVRNSMVEYVVLPYNAAQDFGPVPPWLNSLRILEVDDELLWKGRSFLTRRYLDVYSPVWQERDRTVYVRQFFPTLPPSLKDNPVWKVSLDSEGFRNSEFPTRKSPSVFRIVSLGDSWTFGANVDHQDAYPQILAAKLSEEFPASRFEVVNLGVMAYSSYQGLRLFRSRVRELQPDFVLIGFGMNDSSVAGYRDKDAARRSGLIESAVKGLLNRSEMYKLSRYIADVINHKPFSLGDYMKNLAKSIGTEDEIWIGREASESADYDKLEPITRVSPNDYEENITAIIALARSHGSEAMLLYNELWDTPYRMRLENIARRHEVALVDSKALVDGAKRRIEQELENRLDLRPLDLPVDSHSDLVEVVFRVYAGAYTVPDAIYITGMNVNLGDGVPNRVAMYDDGTHGDQRANDKVWSYRAAFPKGTTLIYVYTNSGSATRWEGLDLPEVRRLTVDDPGDAAVIYRPIETFGVNYMQADGWHTNAEGYRLIATAVLAELKKNEAFAAHVGTTP